MDVSVIIVNYNTKKLLLQCLNSLFDKTMGVKFEVIVVDNFSTDDSVEAVSQLYPNIYLVRSSINLGFGNANNLGYKYSSGKYVFLLNPDTMLMNNAVKILSDFLKEHLDISIVGGQLYDENRTPAHSYYLYLPSIVWEFNILFCQQLFRVKDYFFRREAMRKGYGLVPYITGADMMLRREDIEKYGLFDSDFFMYFEETELCNRYARYGKSIAFIMSPQILHLEGKSFSFKEDRERSFFQGRKLYYQKCHLKGYTKVADCLYVVTCLSRLCIYTVAWKKKKMSEWWRRLKLFVSVNF